VLQEPVEHSETWRFLPVDWARSFGLQPTQLAVLHPWQSLTLTEQALDLDQRMTRFRLGQDVMRACGVNTIAEIDDNLLAF
jgi:hypothetical protein